VTVTVTVHLLGAFVWGRSCRAFVIWDGEFCCCSVIKSNICLHEEGEELQQLESICSKTIVTNDSSGTCWVQITKSTWGLASPQHSAACAKYTTTEVKLRQKLSLSHSCFEFNPTRPGGITVYVEYRKLLRHISSQSASVQLTALANFLTEQNECALKNFLKLVSEDLSVDFCSFSTL